MNCLYKSNSSISFDNFYNQVGQGRTSDAENLFETSTYGLSQGSLFSQYGSNQVFQALPGILNQQAGYSSAVFHANNPFFYNRDTVYKRMGYQNFISSDYFDNSEANIATFGIKDKLLLKESVPYLERLPQPFYAKYLTVTNHLPYLLDKKDQDSNFKTSNSGSKLVDNYFITNHYLDEAVKEFFDYLKKSGLYDKTVVVLYGDHYGISQTDYKALSTVISKSKTDWTGFDTQNLQKVPFIIHIPGMTNGGIDHTYGGEVDIAPTLEHLLGISTDQYLQLGQDLLSKNRSQLVVMRNGDWVTPELASTSNAIWDVKTGKKLTTLTASQKAAVKTYNQQAKLKLAVSDRLNTENLLKFYNADGFKKIKPESYNYSVKNTIKRLKKASEKTYSSSLIAENGGKSTYNEYVTNAPEMRTYRFKNRFK
ncbi:lipoteichoic acid synthase 2 [Fructobacillus pseudoficulneus]|uniref:Lipoteichoic acid synthase 2 n=1 Tax=Fructobacillus pseudoficulneus TaxID=220714 RepID=A0A3F3GRN0_9LACO|nr:lipoteichoic acid synthase 2 [Fructobacillus pseudoficulneus]